MRILALCLFLICYQQLSAQTCCSGGVPLANNLGLPNEGKGAVFVGLNYDYNNLNTLKAGASRLDDDARLRNTNSVLLNLGYSFTDRFSVETLFSWVNQTRTITQFGNQDFTETTGLGDAVFLVKYAMPDLLGRASTLSLGVGGKPPLGKSDLTTGQGLQLNADLQPGSGAWDVLGWLAVSKNVGFRPSATLSGSLTYRFTGENDTYLNNTSIYEFGNVFQANMGYTDQFLLFNTLFNPGVVFKYRKAASDKLDTSSLPNTGGEWLFIRPELAVTITQNLIFTNRLELPVYSYVDGTQLTPTLRFTSGLSYTFKNNTILDPLK